LELGIPMDGTPAKSHYTPGARFDAHWVLVTLIVPESGKIRIYITIQLEIVARLKSETIILDAQEVPTDVFHGFLLTSAGTVDETSTLVDGELDLGSGIGVA
jgi:hypothetical protein